jgi:hypothetical protein
MDTRITALGRHTTLFVATAPSQLLFQIVEGLSLSQPIGHDPLNVPLLMTLLACGNRHHHTFFLLHFCLPETWNVLRPIA